jgi:hypothetical protein
MSNELFNEEEEFLALLEEEAAELAAKTDEDVLETVSEEVEEPAVAKEEVLEVEDKPTKTPKVEKKPTEKTVALLSTRNVSWNGVGKVEIGYNIVTEEQAEKWLTRNHITVATPEDVAKGYGL